MLLSDSLVAALTALPPSPDTQAIERLDDAQLLDLTRSIADLRKRTDALASALAAAIAHRSTRELGYAGLAERLGARTPERLVQQLARTTLQDARDLVAVGTLPESSTLGAAVLSGRLSVGDAAAISSGLGRATERAPAAVLDDAAIALVAEAPGRTIEQLRVRAREVRDDLDAAGVVDRERAFRERRYLHLSAQDDGMTRLVALLDPESAAQVVAVVDAATSPRRGGPRFVDPDERARAASLQIDTRTTAQLALDTVVELLAAGAAVDPRRLLGRRGAPVQVVGTARELRAATGVSWIEGQPVALSASTAARRACTDGVVAVAVEHPGAVLDVGRTQRLFTARQRAALAVRDQGCRFPGCDRPPSWCEAHHIVPWSQGGRTDIADGLLLCRHHHLLIHDNGWRIERRPSQICERGETAERRDASGTETKPPSGEFALIPPVERDPLQRAVPLTSRSRVIERALERLNA